MKHAWLYTSFPYAKRMASFRWFSQGARSGRFGGSIRFLIHARERVPWRRYAAAHAGFAGRGARPAVRMCARLHPAIGAHKKHRRPVRPMSVAALPVKKENLRPDTMRWNRWDERRRGGQGNSRYKRTKGEGRLLRPPQDDTSAAQSALCRRPFGQPLSRRAGCGSKSRLSYPDGFSSNRSGLRRGGWQRGKGNAGTLAGAARILHPASAGGNLPIG